MPAPKNRRFSLYANVYAPKLCIVRFPDYHVKWATVRTALTRALKRDLGILAKDILLEGLAGEAPGYASSPEDAATVTKLEAAFAGDPDRFKSFYLYAWNHDTQGFDLCRHPLKGDG